MSPGFNFGLYFQQGVVFGRVIERRICNFKPYSPFTIVGGTQEPIILTPQGVSSASRFNDPRNPSNDILFLKTYQSSDGMPWFFHGAFGVKPEFIRMYVRNPEAKDFPGQFPGIDITRPANGDEFGYVSEENSPYDEPSDYVEVAVLPNTHIDATYYNASFVNAYQPRVNILFALYFFQPYSVTSSMVQRFVSGQEYYYPIKPIFGDVLPDGTTFFSQWGVNPVPI
ncbi:MAG: hypothetical protein QXO47_10120, partial [Thermoproteota archaeon]